MPRLTRERASTELYYSDRRLCATGSVHVVQLQLPDALSEINIGEYLRGFWPTTWKERNSFDET
jgi:hypothetical protein